MTLTADCSTVVQGPGVVIGFPKPVTYLYVCRAFDRPYLCCVVDDGGDLLWSGDSLEEGIHYATSYLHGELVRAEEDSTFVWREELTSEQEVEALAHALEFAADRRRKELDRFGNVVFHSDSEDVERCDSCLLAFPRAETVETEGPTYVLCLDCAVTSFQARELSFEDLPSWDDKDRLGKALGLFEE
jgi:hypothetical protein